MKLIQVPAKVESQDAMIHIDPSILAQIIADDPINYTLSIMFNLTKEKLNEYSHLNISVWDEDEKVNTNLSSPLTAATKSIHSSVFQNPITIVAGAIQTKMTAAYPAMITDKLRAGIHMVETLNNSPTPLVSKTINISSLPSYNECIHGALVEYNNQKNQQSKTSTFNPTSLLHRVVKEKITPTQYTSHQLLSKINSATQTGLTLDEYRKGYNSPLLYDVAKYMFDGIQNHPNSAAIQSYSLSRITGNLPTLQTTSDLLIKKEWGQKHLTIRFELFKADSSPAEAQNIPLHISSLVEAYLSSYTPPTLSLTTNPKDANFTLSITDYEEPGVFLGWNIYEKNILQDGTVGIYKQIGSTKTSSSKTSLFAGIHAANLSVLRVIPIMRGNNEGNIFSDIVIGNGYKAFGNLTVIVRSSHTGIYIDTHGLPEKCKLITLYFRNCTDNTENIFIPIGDGIKLVGTERQFSHFVSTLQCGMIYEFYVTCTYVNPHTDGDEIINSNYVMFNNKKIADDKPINVVISKPQRNKSDYSFIITTVIAPSENKIIDSLLKAQIPELYDKYLSPSNNLSDPRGGDQKGVPDYASLFLHEVVRTNMNTSERETFSLVGDGQFNDSSVSRTISNIKELVTTHEYIYQIFTYRKNPIELFKRFVAHGRHEKGNEWFYLPHKWKTENSVNGSLYPDDENGIPIIDAYENFTATSYGETCRETITGYRKNTSLRDITVIRPDRITVKISWDLQYDEVNLYESFIILKIVNGIRSTLGRTCKNYAYHWLTNDDVGTIYYVIIPIMTEWDIGTPGYTDTISIDCEGIIKHIPTLGLSTN